MAVVAANWAPPVSASLLPPVAHKIDRFSFCCNLCVHSVDSNSLVQSVVVNGWRGRCRLEAGVQLWGPATRRVSQVKATADDADNMDDEGVVKDMERYLSELAIEYDNVWDTKPAWCQPWTIVLTGATGISLSWLVLQSSIVTGIVAVLVAAWWYIFLYTYPLAYTQMIAQRRKNQRDGLEDTYGLQRTKDGMESSASQYLKYALQIVYELLTDVQAQLKKVSC